MELKTVIALIALLFLLVLLTKLLKALKGVLPYRYKKCNALLTKTEALFCRQLLCYLPSNKGVSFKVRLSDIIESAEKDYKRNTASRNKIQSKHIDFAIYDKNSFQIDFLIELDDKSHFKRQNAKRDEIKNKALEKAGVTLHRVFAKSDYSKDLEAIFSQEYR